MAGLAGDGRHVGGVVLPTVRGVGGGDGPGLRIENPVVLTLELAEPRDGWDLALAHVDPDQSQVLLGGVTPNSDARAERLWLGRLLDALAVSIVGPAMIEAAQVVALHPAGTELGATVGTTEGDGEGLPAFATVEREVLVQDAQRLRAPDRKLLRSRYGMPEAPQVAAGERIGAGERVVLPLRAGTVCWR